MEYKKTPCRWKGFRVRILNLHPMGVPLGNPQAGVLMRHGSSSPLCQISKEICFRQAGESRNTRDTGGLQSGGSAPGARLPETSFIGAILLGSLKVICS
jgi:hypothetical protein